MAIPGNDIIENWGFTSQNVESLEKILRAMMDSKDIEMKTEINNPLNLAKLLAIADWLEENKYECSAKILKTFITGYLKYMVSNNREGRKEIIQALSESMKREKSLTEKLTQPP